VLFALKTFKDALTCHQREERQRDGRTKRTSCARAVLERTPRWRFLPGSCSLPRRQGESCCLVHAAKTLPLGWERLAKDLTIS